MQTLLPLLGGFVLLVIGGELLIRGAVRVAAGLGVSPLVIGLTLVGFGTSTPELVTSVQAALNDSPGIAYGNIVGSNIANLLLIVGVSSVITPLVVSSGALKRDGVFMIAVTLVFVAFALTVPLGRIVGVLFLCAIAGYIFVAFRQERAGAPEHGAVYDKTSAAEIADPALTPPAAPGALLVPLLIAVAGLALVVVGGALLVSGATSLARVLGISETVIGLTVVAVGTSLPELVTSVVAAIRKQAEVAFGNIIGSNIYNLLGIGGATALIAPSEVPAQILSFDNWVMIAASFVTIGLAYTGRVVTRLEGVILLLGYLGYLFATWPT